MRDLASGADVYHVSEQSLPGGLKGLALRADGEVAFVVRRAQGVPFGVGVVSPAQPRPRLIGLPFANYYAVRWAGPLLLVMSAPRYTTGEVADGTLETVDAQTGRVVHVVARGVEDRYINERFDSDGRDVVFVTRDCRGATIHRVALSAPTQTYRPPASCPLTGAKATRLSRSQISVLRSQISVRFSCVGLTAQCIASTGVLTTTRKRRAPVLGRVRPGNAYYSFLHSYADVNLNRRGQRFLAAKGRTCAQVTLTVGDGSLLVEGEFYAPERRTARVCLSSPITARKAPHFAG